MTASALGLINTVRSFLRDSASASAPTARDVLDRDVIVLHVGVAPRAPVALPKCPCRILVIGRGDIPSEWKLPDDGVVDARRQRGGNVDDWQDLPLRAHELGEWLAGGASWQVL